MEDIPRIKLSIGQPIPLSEISNQVDLPEQQVKLELEYALREHYFHFNSRPFELGYSPLSGYLITATSSVGMIKTESFIIDIIPKIPQVSIGKCLGLAQESKLSLLHLNDRSLTNSVMSVNSEYSTIDFIGFSLIDSIIKVKNNGFARVFEEVYGTDAKLKGAISFQDTLIEGRSPINPVSENLESSINIYPNQLLKYALALCSKYSRSEVLRQYSSIVMGFFTGVDSIDEIEILKKGFVKSFSIPRPDYEMALAFAKAIIEGRLISEGDENVFIPSFSLDLDKVFESYCSNQITSLIETTRFDVHIQKQYKHDISPEIDAKNIIPDIVVEKKENNKKIIIDIKNKYSSLRNDGKIAISNDDLYQLSYYAQTLKAEYCILVYPGSNPSLQYPLKSSESEQAYLEKKKDKMNKLVSESVVKVFEERNIKLMVYNIDINGTLANTRRSVASLCQLTIDILDGIH